MWIGRSWVRMRSAIGAEAGPGVVVAVGDRLVGHVARRQHDRLADRGQQQVVQRRVGQHHPELADARARPPAATAAPGRRGSSTIGRAGDASSSAAASSTTASCRAAATSAAITANGLSSRCLRARSVATAGSRRRQRGEVVAAEPLDGDDLAGAQRRRDLLERRVELRPAGRAAHRLGVEAAVGRVVVLGAGTPAHIAKRGHRRVRPVVGDRRHDRVARPAVRAVRERVAVAPVGRVGDLATAVGARGHVGRDERGRGAGRRWPGSRTSSCPSGVDVLATRRRRSTASGGARSTTPAANVATRSGGPSTSITTPAAVLTTKPGQAELGRPAGGRGAGTRRPARCRRSSAGVGPRRRPGHRRMLRRRLTRARLWRPVDDDLVPSSRWSRRRHIDGCFVVDAPDGPGGTRRRRPCRTPTRVRSTSCGSTPGSAATVTPSP